MPISPTDTGKSNRTSVSRISAYFETQTGHPSSVKKTLLAFQLDGMRLSTKGATLELSHPAFDQRCPPSYSAIGIAAGDVAELQDPMDLRHLIVLGEISTLVFGKYVPIDSCISLIAAQR